MQPRLLIVLFFITSAMLMQPAYAQDLSDLEQQLQQGLALLDEGEKADDEEMQYEALVFLADFFRGQEYYDKALVYYQRAVALTSASGMFERRFYVQNQLAQILYLNGEYQNALEILQDVIAFETDPESVITILKYIANAQEALHQYEGARNSYMGLCDFCKEYSDDKDGEFTSLLKAFDLSIIIHDLETASQILERAESVNKTFNIASISELLIKRGILNSHKGEGKEALAAFFRSEELDNKFKTLAQHHISLHYMASGNNKRALLYNERALETAREEENLELLSELYTTTSNIYQRSGKFDRALAFYKAHLATEDTIRQKQFVIVNRLNQVHNFLDNAENRFRQRGLENELQTATFRQMELNNQTLELEATRERLESEKRQQQISILEQQKEVEAANLRAVQIEAQRAQQNLRLIRQQSIAQEQSRMLELLNQERQLDSLQASQTKLAQEQQIALLERNKEKAAIEAEIRESSLRFFYWITALLALVLAIALASWFYTRSLNRKLATQNVKIEEQRTQVEQERERAEALLLNILPQPIAEELKLKGSATPLKYDSASVLFTDFVGFTSISSILQPEEIVEELNDCFSEFDEISHRHHLEKIKTIGDSYMCAGGIPNSNESHAQDAVAAAKEMIDYMNHRNNLRRQNGLRPWPIRVGIHSGELVAGVVGRSKFAYDIWGDTVNVASRMEQGAEPNSINISEATHEMIKEYFNCEYRGEVDVKNRGRMGMYKVVA